MMECLVEYEVERLTQVALAASSREEALYLLSTQISQDLALRKLVESDPLDIA